MPYKNNEQLPKGVKDNLPKHGQDIYREAFNNSYDHYKDPNNRRGDIAREEAAHRTAWAAVKERYEKGKDGEWHAK